MIATDTQALTHDLIADPSTNDSVYCIRCKVRFAGVDAEKIQREKCPAGND